MRPIDERIVGLRVEYRDHLFAIACDACGAHYEVRLPAVIMVATPACPACGQADRLEPGTIARACDRLLPSLDKWTADAANAEVAALVRAWTSRPDVRAHFDCAGVDLATCGAFHLLPLVLEQVLLEPRGAA